MNDLNDAKTQEQIERIIQWRDECAIPAIQKMVDILVPYVQGIIDAIAPLVGEAIKNMTEIYEATINSYRTSVFCTLRNITQKNASVKRICVAF